MSRVKKAGVTALCILFWLGVWQLAAMKINNKILLVSPIEVAERLVKLVPSAEFRESAAFSSARILMGFALGMTAGCLLAWAAGKVRFIRILFSPLVSVM